MNSYAFCPVSVNKIDEHVARFNATQVTVLIIAAILFQNLFISAFLLVDFILRGVELSKYSPIAILSKFIIKSLKIKAKPINAGPKIFAARIGIIFSLAAVVLTITGAITASNVVLTIFGVCAFLEGAFGFCVACQIYPFVYRLTFSSK
jgi:hypothetical protein